MFPGLDYRPTRAELEGRAPKPPPDAVQRAVAAAGENVLAGWGELEDALEDALEGAPRDALLPGVLAAAGAHALYVRVALLGADAHAPVEVRAKHAACVGREAQPLRLLRRRARRLHRACGMQRAAAQAAAAHAPRERAHTPRALPNSKTPRWRRGGLRTR
jgi:hypothetical protein